MFAVEIPCIRFKGIGASDNCSAEHTEVSAAGAPPTSFSVDRPAQPPVAQPTESPDTSQMRFDVQRHIAIFTSHKQ